MSMICLSIATPKMHAKQFFLVYNLCRSAYHLRKLQKKAYDWSFNHIFYFSVITKYNKRRGIVFSNLPHKA
uniref:Uncharacterized protein n=1 Tax=Arundo donax TaxID=35708 RepID=A0A0A9DMY0_ARUDO